MGGMADGATRSALGIKPPAMRRVDVSLGRGCMTLGARFGNTLRAGGGKRIANRAGIVNTVTIHTLGRPLAPGGQQLAVNTGLVFCELVHPRLLVLAHDVGVAVALSAKFWDPLARDPNLEALVRVHRDVLVGFIRITAVTVGTTDRLGEMDVIGELQTHPFHDTMTIKTGILAGTGSAAQQGSQRDQ